ncbi:MAG: hypothetical protein OER88_13255, partial [Planctomycetota bacterium]|nr:hypothetical protein [Planctomycetota bacterium]
MSVFWILFTGAATAWGVRVSIQRKAAVWGKVLAVMLILFAGVNAVLLTWWIGDGRLWPGVQVSPDVKNWFLSRYDGVLPPPDPLYGIAALVAHVAMLIAAREKTGPALWPVTAWFLVVVVWFQTAQSERPTHYRRAVGPNQNAFLTIAPAGDKSRLIFAHGARDSGFVDVLHVAEAESVPVDTKLMWTHDGEAIVFQIGRRRIFALPLEGEPVGFLPERSHEWPEANPNLESVNVRNKLSLAAKNVDVFIHEHGG